ncbi:MAG TPA: FkbM family methyltransferase, partial [Balneolaceae bacterium]|nr:FkbM family methyltransferase [Balneolaceae bacterium]
RTWFGSTNAEVTKELSAKHDLISETVEQKTLDEYLPKMRGKRTVIKIDTEGNELAVLRGALKVLQEIKPVVIFESWDDSNRLELLRFLKEQSYEIYNIPWQPDEQKPPLKPELFINSTASNFAAVYSNSNSV